MSWSNSKAVILLLFSFICVCRTISTTADNDTDRDNPHFVSKLSQISVLSSCGHSTKSKITFLVTNLTQAILLIIFQCLIFYSSCQERSKAIQARFVKLKLNFHVEFARNLAPNFRHLSHATIVILGITKNVSKWILLTSIHWRIFPGIVVVVVCPISVQNSFLHPRL